MHWIICGDVYSFGFGILKCYLAKGKTDHPMLENGLNILEEHNPFTSGDCAATFLTTCAARTQISGNSIHGVKRKVGEFPNRTFGAWRASSLSASKRESTEASSVGVVVEVRVAPHPPRRPPADLHTCNGIPEYNQDCYKDRKIPNGTTKNCILHLVRFLITMYARSAHCVF